ncbi:MAG: S8 family serine peptidase [Clostridiaceae bacterium]
MIFQEVSWIRSNANKFSPDLRKKALEWYTPFRFVPFFLQKYLKGIRQLFRKVPVIVQMHPSKEINFRIGCISQTSECKVNRELHLINAFSSKVNARTLEKLIKDDMVKKIWYDSTVKAVSDAIAQAVKIPDAWNTNKATGKGIGIAVIDTGVYPHPYLSGRIIAFKDFVNDKITTYDDNGHGTLVALDVASDGAFYKGAAPGANIIGVKVLNRFGSCNLSTVIEGIQWCINNKDLYGIKVINMSLTDTAVKCYKTDPLYEASVSAWNNGIFVCAAANAGPETRTIFSPGKSQYITPVCSGIASLILETDSNLSPEAVKDILKNIND